MIMVKYPITELHPVTNENSKYYIGSYLIHRPTVARVINEDTYSFGVVTYNDKGRVVFEKGESYATVWPCKQ